VVLENEVKRAPTEADLEAAIHAVLNRTFPFVGGLAIEHQTHFKFHVGRAKVSIDGASDWVAEGRADIILRKDDHPFAVLELKRKGIPLQPADMRQGISYARMLDPLAPLVIVTNGDETNFYVTYSGEEWCVDGDVEASLKTLLNNAAKLAGEDMLNAVDTLMGTSSAVWASVVRQISTEYIEGLTGSLGDSDFPFSNDFLIPRSVTMEVLSQLGEGQQYIILDGEPFSGKSNIFREMVQRTAESLDIAVLLVESGAGGCFQCVADALSRALGWSISKQEARKWMDKISTTKNMKLVVLIDQFNGEDDESRRELEDLVELAQRGGISIVIAMDDAIAERLTRSNNSRYPSRLGRGAKRVKVDVLNDTEFFDAMALMSTHGAVMIKGAQCSSEYRHPWILRALTRIAVDNISPDSGMVFLVPSMLGLDFISQVRSRFCAEELRHAFRELAHALLSDYLSKDRSDELEVDAATNFIVRKEALFVGLAAATLGSLKRNGYLRPGMHADKDPIMYVRLPELLVSELAYVVSDQLQRLMMVGVKDAVLWLLTVAENLPLGEVIVAHAISTWMVDNEDFTSLLAELIAEKPINGLDAPKTKFAIRTEDILSSTANNANITFGGRLSLELGIKYTEGVYFSDNFSAWLILSHLLAGKNITCKETGFFLHKLILTIVGQSNVVLRRPGSTEASKELFTYQLPDGSFVAALEAGMVEPITYAMFRILKTKPGLAQLLIDELKNEDSVHLLMRTMIALSALIDLGGERGEWALEVLNHTVMPAWQRFL